MPAPVANHDTTRYRTAGAAMAVITLVALVALAHHPAGRPASSPHDTLAQMAAMRSSAAVVHGVLIAMFASLAAAHAVFAGLLGAARPSVRLDITAYGIACSLLTVAMLCDGFVAPQLAFRFAASTAVHADHAQSMLVAIGIIIQFSPKLACWRLAWRSLLSRTHWRQTIPDCRWPGRWRWWACWPACCLPPGWCLAKYN